MNEKQMSIAKDIDKRRGFSNLTQEQRIDKLHLIYNEDIVPFLKYSGAGERENYHECASCHDPRHFYSPIYEIVPNSVYENGTCACCKKETKVFHPILYRHIVLKYGFIVNDWEKSQIPFTFINSTCQKIVQ